MIPFCMPPEEDTARILSCPHADAVTNWNTQLGEFVIQLQKKLTSNQLLPSSMTQMHGDTLLHFQTLNAF